MLPSKDFKVELGDADSFLSRVRSVPIRHWRYNDPALGEGDHIALGPRTTRASSAARRI